MKLLHEKSPRHHAERNGQGKFYGSVTVISAVAVKPRTLPVIVAVPSPTLSTWQVFWPVDTTVATVGSDDSHCTASVAPAGVRFAVSVTEVPTSPDEDGSARRWLNKTLLHPCMTDAKRVGRAECF